MEMFNYDLVKSHPNFTEVEENIWVIKNFVDNSICDDLVKFAESSKEEDWWHRDKKEWWHGKFLFIDETNKEIHEIFRGIKKDISALFTNDWFLSDMGSIHRMQNGQTMFQHSDNPTEDMGRNNFVQLSFVLYISDFEGGEIFYPRILDPDPLQYKASKGDLLIHPGVGRYLHGVKPVIGDKVRYVTTTFAYDKRVKELRDKGVVYEDVKTGKPFEEIKQILGSLVSRET